MTFYTICMTFIIYSFFGWCAEVIFSAADRGKFTNRGFLTGPVCPIYGFGMVALKLLLTVMKENIFLLFFGSVLIAAILELAAGFLMKMIFRQKWWDYSKEPFNLGGYICLKFSLLWGIGGSAVILGVDPVVQGVVEKLQGGLTVVIMVIILLVFAFDLFITVQQVLKFNKRVDELEDKYDNVKRIADKLGGRNADGEAFGAEREMLENKYRRKATDFAKLCRNTAFKYKRIISAFPSMTSGRCANAIERLKAAVVKLDEETKE
ncbi:MAG: putative ABC transporter permease [Clostridia bacterium]|nr:putative ABC transporter permease [Clostridia bacterium]